MSTILIITNKLDFPTDEVINRLDGKADIFRLNTEQLCNDVNFTINIDNDNYFKGKFISPMRSISMEKITSVFYRRPQYPIFEHLEENARKFALSEISAFSNWLWESLKHCFWVSKPSRIRAAESKIDQLRIAQKFGFSIPKTLITNCPNDVLDFYEMCNGKIINKVLGRGVIENGDSAIGIYTHKLTKDLLLKIDYVKDTPCLFQEYIEKLFELRITIVGNKVFAAEIHSQNSERTKVDWRRYDIENTPHKIHTLPPNIEKACIQLTNHYNIAFGAIDMIVTPERKYVFLEINPNGQWLWIEKLTGLPISEEIAQILIHGHA